jgi:gamma-glutamylcyclotransferase (GGCT)/AIG2-like uncharacterized protein YtfP
MLNNLFVYGTLCPGERNHYLLADVQGDWYPATLQAVRTDRGWGSAKGYPGIELSDNPDDIVHGWLLKAKDLTATIPQLDEFEGAGYQRVIVEIRYQPNMDMVQTTTAFTYELCFSHQPEEAGPSQFVTKNY